MNAVIVRLTVRALLLQRRSLALVALAAAPLLMSFVFAIAARAGANHRLFYSTLVQELFLPTVAALVALVVGVSALGDEREDGTVLYLVATPVPRLVLVGSTIAAAWITAMVLLVPSLLLSAVLALGHRLTAGDLLWPLLGTALACLAYCSASAWLSLRVRRPVVIGVLYILLWEGSIATFAASASKLSIAAYGRALVAQALPQANPPVAGPVASFIVLSVVVAGACWLGARLLSRVELP